MLKTLKNSAVLGAIATLFGISVASTPAQAQIETSFGNFAPSVIATSNYIFRGLSQSKREPALQANLEYTYPIGDFTPYLGAFASTVRFPANNTPAGSQTMRQHVELDLFGGVRYATPLAGLTLDAGFISYTYPNNTADQNKSGGPNTYGNPQWNEVYGKFAYDFSLAVAVGSVFYAKDFSYAGGEAWYYEGGFDVPLPYAFLLSGRVGRQTIQNNYSFGVPDYTTWNVGLARDFEVPFTFTLAAVYSDTNIKKGSSLGLDKVAGTPGVLLSDTYEQTKGQVALSFIKKF
ncbi:MAG: TorF family putative porin [Rhodospirillales bacterium]|jgi:uncharacterized protein (TIGR02001 family)|nr:TorF family putative porin [Magnetospirillum sp.]